jgi:hypothetical protein
VSRLFGALWRGLRWALLIGAALAAMALPALLPLLVWVALASPSDEGSHFWRNFSGPLCFGGLVFVLLIGTGVGQMAVALSSWPRRITNTPSWHPGYEFPPRRGATLISAVIALALAGMCLAMALSVYLGGSRARIAQTHRLAALAVCQSQIETLRAGGFSALPSVERSFTSPDDPALRGTLSVAPGTSGTRLVTATAGWPPEDRAPAGRVTLTALFAPRGVSP